MEYPASKVPTLGKSKDFVHGIISGYMKYGGAHRYYPAYTRPQFSSCRRCRCASHRFTASHNVIKYVLWDRRERRVASVANGNARRPERMTGVPATQTTTTISHSLSLALYVHSGVEEIGTKCW